MDTTHLEYIAEDLIAHKLQRSGLLVAKPKFDRNGADLIALLDVDDGAKFCRIQCKGRSLKTSKSSNIKVPAHYVVGAFFVFLYVDVGDSDTHIFCFSADEIKTNWKLTSEKDRAKKIYVLNIYKKYFLESPNKSKLLEFSFNSAKIESVKKEIKKSKSREELKFFELIKIQKEILNGTKQRNELKSIVTKLKHLKEIEKLHGENLKSLERQYEVELAKLGSELPDNLINRINELLMKNTSAPDILIKVKETIPSDISETILNDYISKVLIQQIKT